MKWHLIVDVAGCLNCNNCVLASKDELVGNSFPGFTAPHPPQGQGVVRIERKVRGTTPMVDTAYLPRLCNHCDDAPCLKAGAATGAVRKREDGIVIFDPEKAKGRRDLVDVCPYGAVIWNEAEQLPQTWFFDAHLLDAGWKAPRCAQACPTQAIEAVRCEDAAFEQRVRAEQLSPPPGADAGATRPRVYYRNLHRIDRCFIGASVVARLKGRDECLEGAAVTLRHPDGRTDTGRTDAFGEFKFDRLLPDSGTYELTVTYPGSTPQQKRVALAAESVYLGDWHLGAVA